MTLISDQILKLNRLQLYAVTAVRLVLIESAEFIEELNRMQLSEGQRADGSFLPNYSPTSITVFGKPPGPIKLFDEGDFYEGINANIFDSEFRIAGEDEKTEMLISKYGDMILGLSEKSQQVLIEQIRPQIIVKMREFLARI